MGNLRSRVCFSVGIIEKKIRYLILRIFGYCNVKGVLGTRFLFVTTFLFEKKKMLLISMPMIRMKNLNMEHYLLFSKR
jgi:hypothetical protein